MEIVKDFKWGLFMNKIISSLINRKIFGSFFLFIFLLMGCENIVNNGITIDYPGYEYIIDFERCPKLTLSPTAQIWLEYFISKPDSEGFKKYIEEEILPGFKDLPHSTINNENLSKLIYTVSLLEAWLQLDLIVIRDNYFKKNPKLMD